MLKKNPIASAEADLAALEKRRAGLDARRTSAASASLAAVTDRRRLLCDSDEPPAAALDKADRACRDAADAEAGAADALAELDSRIAGVKERLAQLREAADRDRHAVAIEASAREADAAIERMRKAAGELDSARRDLVAALLPEAVSCYAPPSNSPAFGPTYLTTVRGYDHRGEPDFDALNVEHVAARVVGHFVTTALPGLGIARLEDAQRMHMDGQPTRILASVDGDAARSLLTDPMRAAALRVREGQAPTPIRGARPPRRRADGWTTDAEGRSFDKAGVQVTNGGFYLDDTSDAA